MIIRVRILAGGVTERSMDLEDGSTYIDVLNELGLNPETVIIMVDGRPVPADDEISAHQLEILRIVSGG